MIELKKEIEAELQHLLDNSKLVRIQEMTGVTPSQLARMRDGTYQIKAEYLNELVQSLTQDGVNESLKPITTN
jgi:hypothetical protein